MCNLFVCFISLPLRWRQRIAQHFCGTLRTMCQLWSSKNWFRWANPDFHHYFVAILFIGADKGLVALSETESETPGTNAPWWKHKFICHKVKTSCGQWGKKYKNKQTLRAPCWKLKIKWGIKEVARGASWSSENSGLSMLVQADPKL